MECETLDFQFSENESNKSWRAAPPAQRDTSTAHPLSVDKLTEPSRQTKFKSSEARVQLVMDLVKFIAVRCVACLLLLYEKSSSCQLFDL